MAKGQKRSTREVKKPKAAKPAQAAAGARQDNPVRSAKMVNDDRKRPATTKGL